MEAEHHTALEKALLKRFDNEELGLALSRDLRRRSSIETPIENEAAHAETPSDKEISSVQAELREVALKTEPHSLDRMEALESVSDFVVSHGNSARNALVNANRGRDTGGLER